MNQSSGTKLQATTTGVTRENLRMSTTVSFEQDQMFYQTTVTLTNLSNSTMQNVRYVRSFDPDQDKDRKNTYITRNKVISNPNTPYDATGKNYKVGKDQVAMVVARGATTSQPFFFVAFDTRARASRGVSFAPTSAWQTKGSNGLWVQNTGVPTTYTAASVANRSGQTLEDDAIAITFACGDLAPGASTTFTFYSSLAPADKLADVVLAIEKTVGGPTYHVYQNTDGSWPTEKPESSSDKFGETYTAPAKTHYTAKNLEKTPREDDGSIEYKKSIPDGGMEYSDDGGKTWRDLDGTLLDNLPAGEYYFRFKGIIAEHKAPSDPTGPIKLTAKYDLNTLLIDTDSNGGSIKAGTVLTAVTNLDGSEYASGLTYRWLRVDTSMFDSEDRYGDNIDFARLEVGTGKTYTVQEEDEGLIVVLETTWHWTWKKDADEVLYEKTLSTPTPVVATAAEAAAAAAAGSELKLNAQDNTGAAIAGASVQLWQGNTIVASGTSDAAGAVTFASVRDGVYNVVVTESGTDGRSKTVKLDFPEDYNPKTGFTVQMPEENVSSTLIVSGDAPAIVVDGLENEAVAQAEDGSLVDVQLTVSSMESLLDVDDVELTIVERETKQEQQAITDAAKAPGDVQKQLQFFNMTVNKVVDNAEPVPMGTTSSPLVMTIPFVGIHNLFYVNVYRYHGGAVDTLTTTPNGAGEYFEIGLDQLILHTKSFSTYAIGFTDELTKEQVAENFELVLKAADGDATGSIYDIILKSQNPSKIINRFTSADLTFELTPSTPATGNIVYRDNVTGNADAYIKVNDALRSSDRYEFYVNGKKGSTEISDVSGAEIKLGQVTFGGYGTKWTFSIKEAVINTTDFNDNIVITTQKSDAALTVNTDADTNANPNTALIRPLTINPLTQNLVVNVTFPNTVEDHVSDYQDMTLTISGGDLAQDIVVKLGETANLGGGDPTVNVTSGVNPGTYPYAATAKITSVYTALGDFTYTTTTDQVIEASRYTVTLTDILTQNTQYTVTISGKGYRTARYNVLMGGVFDPDTKTLTFWNNVMDENTVIETGKDATVQVTYLAGDIVEDAQINIYDLSAVVSYFGTLNTTDAVSEYAKYDLNRDGKIDSVDVAYVLVSWGR